MISFENICKKLGFNPLNRKEAESAFLNYYGKITTEDDSKPSIYSVLSPEEREYLTDLLFEKYRKEKKDTQ